MDHLAQDLTVALEESESCGPISFDTGRKWGMRRRTQSAGNLRMYLKTEKPADNQSDESTSSTSEIHGPKQPNKPSSFHQSDSDEMPLGFVVARALNRSSLRMKHPIHPFFRGRYSRLGKLCQMVIK